MGAAKDSVSCGLVTFNQVWSVGEIALNLATLGSSSAGTNSAGAAAELSKLQKMFK